MIDSDALNHAVLARPEVAQQLRDWWGPQAIGPDGRVDRAAVAQIIFANEDEKRRLESLTHPLIDLERRAKIAAVETDPAVKAIILDSPLLFESNLDRECDSVVFVEAHANTRLERLRQTRGWDSAQLRRREQWQTSPDEKRRRADFVVRNEGPIEELRLQVADVLGRILA